MVPRVGFCLWTGPRAVPLCLPAQSPVTDLPALPGPSRRGLATPGSRAKCVAAVSLSLLVDVAPAGVFVTNLGFSF